MSRQLLLIAVATIALMTAVSLTAGVVSASASPVRAVPAAQDAPVVAPIVRDGLGSVLTDALIDLAFGRAKIVLEERYPEWAESRVVKLTTATVKRWVKSKAKDCSWILPDWFFCSQPPSSRWGRGMALRIGGGRPGEFASPWRPDVRAQRMLFPGYVFWLTCWSKGATIDNGVARSNLWYRLTNGLWVSDGWLDTGTNAPLRDVRHC
jgi:hypothetical protein